MLECKKCGNALNEQVEEKAIIDGKLYYRCPKCKKFNEGKKVEL